MKGSALKEDNDLKKNDSSMLAWMSTRVSYLKEYELAFDTSKAFHYRVRAF